MIKPEPHNKDSWKLILGIFVYQTPLETEIKNLLQELATAFAQLAWYSPFLPVVRSSGRLKRYKIVF